MNKYIKLVMTIVALVILLIGAGVLYKKLASEYTPDTDLQISAEDKHETETVPAIDFVMENQAGEEVTLFSLVGKPMVLNFWASWCGPCKMELPDFQAAYERYGSEIEFVMVNMTDGMQETKESATEFIESEDYTLPFYFDMKQEAAYGYGIYSLPTTYFVDGSGNIVAGAKGMLDAEALEVGISMIYSSNE